MENAGDRFTVYSETTPMIANTQVIIKGSSPFPGTSSNQKLYEKVPMYSVSKLIHPRYGSVIHIERDANGLQLTPFQVVQAAIKERRLWQETGVKKVRILVDDQVMSPKQADQWARDEYHTLLKCAKCAKILPEDVFQHRLSSNLFCSADCTDKDYNDQIEKLRDEEEIEL